MEKWQQKKKQRQRKRVRYEKQWEKETNRLALVVKSFDILGFSLTSFPSPLLCPDDPWKEVGELFDEEFNEEGAGVDVPSGLEESLPVLAEEEADTEAIDELLLEVKEEDDDASVFSLLLLLFWSDCRRSSLMLMDRMTCQWIHWMITVVLQQKKTQRMTQKETKKKGNRWTDTGEA